VVIIPGDKAEQEINGHGEKNFEKRKVLMPMTHAPESGARKLAPVSGACVIGIRREWKTPREKPISGTGSEYDTGTDMFEECT